MRFNAISVSPNQDALIDINIQTAFMTGGGMLVEGGDKIVPIVNDVHRHFARRQRFLSLERHPPGHIALASSYEGFEPLDELTQMKTAGWKDGGKKESHVAPYRGLADGANFLLTQLHSYLVKVNRPLVLCPDHALVGSGEDVLHPDVDPLDYAYAQICGTDPSRDTYSVFRDDLWKPTGLVERIRRSLPEVKRVFLTGLSHDGQIGNSALDALHHVFEVVIIADATSKSCVYGRDSGMEAKLKSRNVRFAWSSQLHSK